MYIHLYVQERFILHLLLSYRYHIVVRMQLQNLHSMQSQPCPNALPPWPGWLYSEGKRHDIVIVSQGILCMYKIVTSGSARCKKGYIVSLDIAICK